MEGKRWLTIEYNLIMLSRILVHNKICFYNILIILSFFSKSAKMFCTWKQENIVLFIFFSLEELNSKRNQWIFGLQFVCQHSVC